MVPDPELVEGSKGRLIMQKKNILQWGYLAGIISGITYGMNPLFGVPVINKGLDVNSLLFYRYGVATLVDVGLYAGGEEANPYLLEAIRVDGNFRRSVHGL